MCQRKVATLVLATVLGVLTSGAVAAAQSKTPSPPLSRPNISHIGNGAGLTTTDGAVHPPFVIGWNYYHLANCTMYQYNGYDVLVMYTVENGGYYYTYDSQFQSVIEPACQSGNWIAFHVYDGSSDWNQVWTYTYK